MDQSWDRKIECKYIECKYEERRWSGHVPSLTLPKKGLPT